MIKTIRWRWGIFVALAIALLSMFPQASLCVPGSGMDGGNAFFYTDEPPMAQSRTHDGRARRNVPHAETTAPTNR